MRIKPTRSAVPYSLLVRPFGDSGEGPTTKVAALPVLDTRPPTRVSGLRITGRSATWNAARDPQSGIQGYHVQLRVNGRWTTPKLVKGRRAAIGFASRVRVRALDWAGNFGAWSAAGGA